MVESEIAIVEDAASRTGQTYLDDLLPALRRLDHLLERAVAAAKTVYGPEAATDLYRGLYLSSGEMERLLSRDPGGPTLCNKEGEEGSEGPPPAPINNCSRLGWLMRAFGLSLFDVDVILIALAPELDLRYERLYAYLQDDVTRRRPSVDLALNLLCPAAKAKLAGRVSFASDAPLIRHGLIHLIPDPNRFRPPLLAHYLKLDEQIVNLLLGESGLDARLTSFCQLIDPCVTLDTTPLSDVIKQSLPSLIADVREAREPLHLYFQGLPGTGKRFVAEALACAAGARLLHADLGRALTAETGFEQLLKLLFREAWFQDAILYLGDMDALRADDRTTRFERLLEAVAEDRGVVIMAGAQPWAPAGRGPAGVITVNLPVPDFAWRRESWAIHLAAAGVTLAEPELDSLAGRFRLTESRIADAVATARNHARLRAETSSDDLLQTDEQITIGDLFATARAQSGHELSALARKVEPVSTWQDIVLPSDTLAQLREICQRAVHHYHVLGAWGFRRKLSTGKGVNVLFAGPSGTGKTMAAEIIANELGLDLYKIDLAGVVSKYIGETEKNLDRIFRAAEDGNAILFFDEADALFGKRSEVRDSHDRYANIEISYLLQKMEEYEGVAILATNLRQNLDEAFVRRLAFTVHFPFPDEASRRRIWDGIWPAELPLADDVDLDFLAHKFKLSGGNIKNIALAAAFLAAENVSAVTMSQLIRATRREYQKLGKSLSDAELNGFRIEGQLIGR